MTEYALSTDEVREAFKQTTVWLPEVRAAAYGEAFDRWLAVHDAEVAAKAWDEAAALDAGCHDCIALGGHENPYRENPVHTDGDRDA